MNPASALVSDSPQQSVTGYGIGASEAAVAIGVSDYRRPIDAWLVKTGRRPPFDGNEKTFWGHALEPIIRAHYVEQHGVTVYVPPESLYHHELAFVRATPDGIVINEQGEWQYVAPQVKNIGWRMERAWEESSEQLGRKTAPVDYFVQGVVEMAVTDLPRIDFAVFCGGQNYFEVTLERDLAVEGDVLEELTKFWRLVEEDRQPDLDASESFRGHLLKQIKRKAHVTATVDDLRILDRWRDVAQDMKKLKAEESKIKNLIAARLANADANRLTSELGDITVGAPRRKTAWKAIAEQLSPLCKAMDLLSRELLGLRAEADLQDNRTFAVNPVVQRIDDIRNKLDLVLELNHFDSVVARHTTHGDPVINRPRAWTKSVDNDGEEES